MIIPASQEIIHNKTAFRFFVLEAAEALKNYGELLGNCFLMHCPAK
jgi:hypothetical protein